MIYTSPIMPNVEDPTTFSGAIYRLKNGIKSGHAYNIHQGTFNGTRHKAGILPKPFQHIRINYLIPKTDFIVEYKYAGNAGLTVKQFKKLVNTYKIKYTGPLVHGFLELDKKYITMYPFVLPVYVLRHILYWSPATDRPSTPKVNQDKKFLHGRKLQFIENYATDVDSYSLTPKYIIYLNLRSYENKIIQDYRKLNTG